MKLVFLYLVVTLCVLCKDGEASFYRSESEKGSHIPEATPKYSETSAIIGEASTWGKGAYKAFNGRIFSFESSCAYIFCRHCVDSGDFNIEIKRGNESEIEKITVVLDSNDISISGDTILVNGESVQIPYNNKLIHIKKYGEYNVLNSRRGVLSLMWDKNNKLSLTLHKQYPTCGLCGNFNSTPGEDINEHIANSKIPGDCPKTLTKNYETCEDGVQHCNKIIGIYFEKCGKVTALASDYKMICIDEYCQHRDKNSTCDTYSELSRLCASDGPGTYESWREDSDVVCEKPSCPEKHIYKECGLSNPATCSNLVPFQDSECVSGCTCPEGYLLDDIGEKGRCVLKDQCPCESNGTVYQSGEVRKGPCGSQCTCQEAKWSCTEALCPGRCKVEGSSITTFDGEKYNHPGNCHFLAIHDKDWSVSVELRPCPSGVSGTCLNSVTLLLNSSGSVDKYVFNRDGTITNDQVGNQHYYYSDKIQIFQAFSSYLQVETCFHVKMQIQIVPVMQLYVSMPPNEFTDTLGLCGSYNSRAEDDFMSSQNILEKSSQAFADSWEMMSCPKGNPPSCISIETERFAEKHCEILLDSSGPFASCHPVVNPKPYEEECKRHTCTCENSQDCLCTILGNYAKACAEEGTYIVGWRTGRCDDSCPSGLVFKYNAKACNSSCRSLSERDRSCDIEDIPVDGCTCPDGMYQDNEGNCVSKSECDCYLNDKVMKPGKLIHIDGNKCVCQDGILLCQTPIDLALQNCSGGAKFVDCSDPKAQRRVDRTCSTRNIPTFEDNLPCKRGCYCPAGMVRNSKGHCIFPDDCPCSFGGQEYDQGSVTSVGCNKCTCIKGSWNCTQNECQTTCHIYGEGHVQTFDRKSYSFDGLCQYSFVEDYCGHANGTFRILTESVPCCEDGLTCSRKIIVAFQDQNVILHDGRVTAVKTTESRECELNGNAYSVHTVGLYLILKFSIGITVIWDKNTRMSVILDPQWNGKVCGLCGNSNGDLKDDFTTRHSSAATGALEFGNSWKTTQECSDTVAQTFPCDSNPYCKAWAVRKCEIIRDSTFRDCHSKVDPSAYYDACIAEACACDMEGKYLGFCTSVAMYAEACSAVGVCVTWRKPDLCPVYCDYYNAPGECRWHYEPCGTVTAKTCKDRVIGQKFSAVLEGCYAKCPDSAPYLDENTMQCVRLSECSCFYNDVIPAGGVIQDNCGRTCYCLAGELVCSGTASKNSPSSAFPLGTSSSGTAAFMSGFTTSSNETIETTLSIPIEALTTGATGASASGAKNKITGDTDFREAGSGAPTAPTIGPEEETSASKPSPGATSPGKSGPSAGEPTRAPVSEVTPSETGTLGTSGPSGGATGGGEGTPESPSSGATSSSNKPGTTGQSAAGSGTTTVASSGVTGTTGPSPGGTGKTEPSSEVSGTKGTIAGVTGTSRPSPGKSGTTEPSAEGSGTMTPSSEHLGTPAPTTGAPGTTVPSGRVSSGGGSSSGTVGTTRSHVVGSETTGPSSKISEAATGTPGAPGSSPEPSSATEPSAGGSGTSGSASGESETPGSSTGHSGTTGTSARVSGTTESLPAKSGTTRPSGPGTGTTGPTAEMSGTTGVARGGSGTTVSAAGLPGTSVSTPGGSGAYEPSTGTPGATGPSTGEPGSRGTSSTGSETTESSEKSRTTRPSGQGRGTSGPTGETSGTTGVTAGGSGATGSGAGLPGTTGSRQGGSGTHGPPSTGRPAATRTSVAGSATTGSFRGTSGTSATLAEELGTAQASTGVLGTTGTSVVTVSEGGRTTGKPGIEMTASGGASRGPAGTTRGPSRGSTAGAGTSGSGAGTPEEPYGATTEAGSTGGTPGSTVAPESFSAGPHNKIPPVLAEGKSKLKCQKYISTQCSLK
ncbi:mucin-19 [Pteronotus mesoamericanus]|uniref:mucin-19 n=1 Tax=Pteronotus mesoamericanus TaxID=1884717 RepID=UPI0023EB9162|nr:mucin-19 [Pteronotus parnellii mesoamericanus]